MFEKEEKQLAEWKERYEQIDIPHDKLDNAIQLGFERMKPVKQVKKRRWMWASVAVATFFLTFIISIRLSPVFAGYVSKVPGLDKLVELIRYDKGLQDALNSDYVQHIGVSQELNGKTLTIDSMIADKEGMLLFYTIESKEAMYRMSIEDARIRAADGSELPLSFSTRGGDVGESITKHTGEIQLHFSEPLMTYDFHLELEIRFSGDKQSFSLPFTVQEQENSPQLYNINETVEIEGQKITVKTVTIHPIRTTVHLEMDTTNTKKLFVFDDIRLLDENGEEWTGIRNGVSMTHVSDSEKIIYLQSNYFRQPKELYLAFGKVQAVDKDDSFILVDTEKKEILRQPNGNKLLKMDATPATISFQLHVDGPFPYDFFGDITDATGKKIDIVSMTSSQGGDYGLPERTATLGFDTYRNPLKIEISAYPTWIEGEAKIRIK